MNFAPKFTKKDFYFSVITGLITGLSIWRIFEYLRVPAIHFGKLVECSSPYTYGCDFAIYAPHWQYNIPWSYFVIIVPILWILGVNFGYFLGKWFGFFNQFGKFAAIGFTNAAVDFGVLNLLIANTGISGGGWYPVFKGISFICAIIPSYFWNRYWAFESAEGGSGPASPTGGFQFAKFMSVAIFAIFINDGTASLVVNYVQPLAGLRPEVWANVGAVIGSAVALTFSFIGFKVAVFKK